MARLALVLLLLAAAPLGAQGKGRDSSTTIPSSHQPPPGMCRIWIDGVPAGRQPAPTDCSTAIRRRPPNARVIFGKELRDQRQRDRDDDPGIVRRPEPVESVERRLAPQLAPTPLRPNADRAREQRPEPDEVERPRPQAEPRPRTRQEPRAVRRPQPRPQNAPRTLTPRPRPRPQIDTPRRPSTQRPQQPRRPEERQGRGVRG